MMDNPQLFPSERPITIEQLRRTAFEAGADSSKRHGKGIAVSGSFLVGFVLGCKYQRIPCRHRARQSVALLDVYLLDHSTEESTPLLLQCWGQLAEEQLRFTVAPACILLLDDLVMRLRANFDNRWVLQGTVNQVFAPRIDGATAVTVDGMKDTVPSLLQPSPMYPSLQRFLAVSHHSSCSVHVELRHFLFDWLLLEQRELLQLLRERIPQVVLVDSFAAAYRLIQRRAEPVDLQIEPLFVSVQDVMRHNTNSAVSALDVHGAIAKLAVQSLRLVAMTLQSFIAAHVEQDGTEEDVEQFLNSAVAAGRLLVQQAGNYSSNCYILRLTEKSHHGCMLRQCSRGKWFVAVNCPRLAIERLYDGAVRGVRARQDLELSQVEFDCNGSCDKAASSTSSPGTEEAQYSVNDFAILPFDKLVEDLRTWSRDIAHHRFILVFCRLGAVEFAVDVSDMTTHCSSLLAVHRRNSSSDVTPEVHYKEVLFVLAPPLQLHHQFESVTPTIDSLTTAAYSALKQVQYPRGGLHRTLDDAVVAIAFSDSVQRIFCGIPPEAVAIDVARMTAHDASEAPNQYLTSVVQLAQGLVESAAQHKEFCAVLQVHSQSGSGNDLVDESLVTLHALLPCRENEV